MRQRVVTVLGALILGACGGGQPATSPGLEAEPAPAAESDEAPMETTSASEPAAEPAPTDAAAAKDTAAPEAAASDGDSFVLQNASGGAKKAHGATPSKIKPTATEAALKFVVIDKDKGPIKGVVVALTAPDGKKFYTPETDTEGYAEVLVPVAQKYDLVYLSLGRQDVAANVKVSDEKNQNIRLTLRFKRFEAETEAAGRFVLSGVNFDTGKATLRPESYARLDSVVEYLSHKPSTRIEISGHTDNVGNPKSNKALSEKRAQACRDYLISKGVDASRIQAVGYGDERPVASNATDEGRQSNRRIEATEL